MEIICTGGNVEMLGLEHASFAAGRPHASTSPCMCISCGGNRMNCLVVPVV